MTRGEDGLLDIRRLPVELGLVSLDLTETSSLTWFAFALYAVVVVLLWRLVNAPFGKVLKAIKQNEARCTFLGYNVVFYKWAAFTISCAVAGARRRPVRDGPAGCLHPDHEPAMVGHRRADDADRRRLRELLGTGARRILYFVARDVLGAYTETWLLWFGLMFMAVVMFKPDGLAGIWQGAVARLRAGAGGPRPPGRRPRSRAVALFEARHLHKRFGDQVVLEDVTLAFEAGPPVRHHGPERRRQDDLLQRADRHATGPIAARSCSTAGTSPASRRTRSRAAGSRAPSSS